MGAVVGDWLAYELAFWFKERITRLPPFRCHPALLRRGLDFFRRWGLPAVFIGRFFGPLRAAVPIIAGLYAMPRAKLASAAIWAAGILSPGFLSIGWMLE